MQARGEAARIRPEGRLRPGRVPLFRIAGTEDTALLEVTEDRELRFVLVGSDGEYGANTFVFPPNGYADLNLRNLTQYGFYEVSAKPSGPVGFLRSTRTDDDWHTTPAPLEWLGKPADAKKVGVEHRAPQGARHALVRAARRGRRRGRSELTVHVAFLTWRDTTHPDGGGSEVFVEAVGRELASRGHRGDAALRPPPRARPGARSATAYGSGGRGGRLTVYLRGLAWLLRHRRDVDVVVDVVNGLPFGSPLVRRRGVVALVHHVHAEQWRIIYPGLAGRDRLVRREPGRPAALPPAPRS